MFSRYRKAALGFTGAFVGSLVNAYIGDNTIDGGEWFAAIAAAFATLGIVVAVPNKTNDRKAGT